MQIFLPLIIILGINAGMVLIFNKKFGEVLPVTLFSNTMIMILSGFFDLLQAGVGCIVLLAVLTCIVLIYLFIAKRQHFEYFAGQYFSLGFYLFLIVFAFVFCIDFGRRIQNWDEIGYWSLRVKEMVRIDHMYNHPDSLLPIHRDYPPFLACFQYLWCKLCGGFQDRWMYMSTHILELSMLIPIVEYFKKKKFKENAVTLFLVFILMVAVGLFVDIENDAMMFKSIYSDAFMAVLSAYLLFFVFKNEKINKFYLATVCLGAASLMLTKPSGLGFFLIITVVMVMNRVMLHKDACLKLGQGFWKTVNKKKVLIVALFTVVIPYGCYRIWEWYVVSLGVPRQFDPEENRNLLGFVKIFLGQGEAYQTETIANYIKSILSIPLLQRPVPMAWWQIFLLTIALFEILRYIVKTQEEKKYIRMLNVITAVSALGYAFYMNVLYVFSYNEKEATGLASFRRYLNTYWMCIWTLLVLLLISIIAQRAKDMSQYGYLWALAAILWVGVINPNEVVKIIPVSPAVETSVLVENIQDNQSVYVLQEKNDLHAITFLRYTMWPNTVDGIDYSSLEQEMSKEEFLEMISSYDYLYVKETDENFFRSVGVIPTDRDNFENLTLYRIDKTGSDIKFKFIGNN